jgi:hypothetical protein
MGKFMPDNILKNLKRSLQKLFYILSALSQNHPQKSGAKIPFQPESTQIF